MSELTMTETPRTIELTMTETPRSSESIIYCTPYWESVIYESPLDNNVSISNKSTILYVPETPILESGNSYLSDRYLINTEIRTDKMYIRYIPSPYIINVNGLIEEHRLKRSDEDPTMLFVIDTRGIVKKLDFNV